MTFKEWTAVVEIAGAVVIGGWVAYQALSAPLAPVSAVAAQLLWAVLFVVIFNILAIIVVAILVSIARREELKDERADERDASVTARSMRNAYAVASVVGAVSLFPLALGHDPAIAAYVLFGGLMLAGVVDAGSRLMYYRIG